MRVRPWSIVSDREGLEPPPRKQEEGDWGDDHTEHEVKLKLQEWIRRQTKTIA